MQNLLDIMARLRDPENGCPWDAQQTFQSIAPYAIEEAYEVADAIDRGALDELRDELGDLLLQVVFHARMAEEQGAFGFADVVTAISDKMVRRHPHVFADAKIGDADEQRAAWEAHKRREREDKGASGGVLDGVSVALPALARAQKLGKRAASVGFDWPNIDGVKQKLMEELYELDEARDSNDADAIADEIGDVLFTVANLARHHRVDAEAALRRANGKFVERFRHVEASIERNQRDWPDFSAAELEALWQGAKRAGET